MRTDDMSRMPSGFKAGTSGMYMISDIVSVCCVCVCVCVCECVCVHVCACV